MTTTHLVVHSGDGNARVQHPTGSLPEALRLVESLANESGVLDASIFELREVPISFQVHYAVEVQARTWNGAVVPAPPTYSGAGG